MSGMGACRMSLTLKPRSGHGVVRLNGVSHVIGVRTPAMVVEQSRYLTKR